MPGDLKAWALIVAAVLVFARAVAEREVVWAASSWAGLSVFIATFAWDAAELGFADGAFG